MRVILGKLSPAAKRAFCASFFLLSIALRSFNCFSAITISARFLSASFLRSLSSYVRTSTLLNAFSSSASSCFSFFKRSSAAAIKLALLVSASGSTLRSFLKALTSFLAAATWFCKSNTRLADMFGVCCALRSSAERFANTSSAAFSFSSSNSSRPYKRVSNLLRASLTTARAFSISSCMLATSLNSSSISGDILASAGSVS